MGIDFLPYETEEIKSNDLALSLLFGKDSFFYGIHDKDSSSYQEIRKVDLPKSDSKAYDTVLEKELHKLGLINGSWSAVHVALFQERFTLVHADHFEVGKEDTYIKNVLRVRKSHRSKSRFISGVNYWGIYTIPRKLENVVINQFPQAAFSHYMVDSISSVNTPQENNSVQLTILENQLLVTAFKTGQLQFSNFYTCANDEEMLYYTLLSYQKANLDPNVDPLTLSGLITEENPCYSLLYRYIRTIDFSYKHKNQPFQQSIFPV